MGGTDKNVCENCILCIKTNNGCECGLTDNTVEWSQPACVDFIKEEEGEQ